MNAIRLTVLEYISTVIFYISSKLQAVAYYADVQVGAANDKVNKEASKQSLALREQATAVLTEGDTELRKLEEEAAFLRAQFQEAHAELVAKMGEVNTTEKTVERRRRAGVLNTQAAKLLARRR